jgi:zinc transport system substrate-binding protein
MLTLLLACSGGPETPMTAPQPEQLVEATAPLVVKTTDWPTQYLVERIGGPLVEAECILPEGEDPAHWSPPGDLVASLPEADILMTNGGGYAAWMSTASLPTNKLVGTSMNVEMIELPGSTHSHGKEGEHSHGEIDPHTWTDPTAYVAQALVVRDALVAARPNQAMTFQKNAGELERELNSLDAQLKAATSDLGQVRMAATHPAWNYLARRYDLKLSSFDVDPQQPPSGDDVHDLEHWQEHNPGAEIVLWETAPSDSVVAALPGFRHVVLDPLESGVDYDYLAQATKNVQVLESLVGEDAP